MASVSTICNGTSGGKYTLTLYYTLNSQDIQSNKSNITLTLKLKRNDGWAESAYSFVSCGQVLKVDSATKVNTSNPIDTRNNVTVTLASWTGDVQHDNDGTLTTALEGSFTMPLSTLTGGSISKSWTLPAIPRASTFSFSDATMGESLSISIQRASSAFTHTLTYVLGGASGTIASGAGASCVWQVPVSLALQVPNSQSGYGTITCRTYSGGSLVGSSSKQFKAIVPPGVIPTVGSLEIQRVDGVVPPEWGIYVRGKSKAALTINGEAGAYGSFVTSRSITGGGYSSVQGSFTTGYLNTVGQNTFTATVRDSRNRTSAPVTQTIDVVDYRPPVITSFSAIRCDASGAHHNEGHHIKVRCDYAISSLNGNNWATASFSYGLYGDIENPIARNIPLQRGVDVIIGDISPDCSYHVEITVADALEITRALTVVPTAAVIMDIKANGLGVAFGKVSELDSTLEVDWDIKLNKGVYLGGNTLLDMVYPVGSIYMSVNSANPGSLMGGTWVRWGEGRVPVGVDNSQSEFDTVEKTGGSKYLQSHAHSLNSHTHSFSDTTSSAGGHHHSIGRDYDGGAGSNRYTVHYQGTDGAGGLTNTSAVGGHTHSVSGTTGASSGNTGLTGSGNSQNLQPYITCYMWKRTA